VPEIALLNHLVGARGVWAECCGNRAVVGPPGLREGGLECVQQTRNRRTLRLSGCHLLKSPCGCRPQNLVRTLCWAGLRPRPNLALYWPPRRVLLESQNSNSTMLEKPHLNLTFLKSVETAVGARSR
jgi:hypothetical protein